MDVKSTCGLYIIIIIIIAIITYIGKYFNRIEKTHFFWFQGFLSSKKWFLKKKSMILVLYIFKFLSSLEQLLSLLLFTTRPVSTMNCKLLASLKIMG